MGFGTDINGTSDIPEIFYFFRKITEINMMNVKKSIVHSYNKIKMPEKWQQACQMWFLGQCCVWQVAGRADSSTTLRF